MDDVIYRQDAVDAIKLKGSPYLFGMTDKDRAIEEAIKNVPSAQQWIPCSERLPEESGRYLLTDKDGEVRFGMFSVNYGMWWGGANKPTAWAFLPKPYDVETKRDEPKPCPFCGHKATVKRDFIIGGFSKYYVCCENDDCKLVVATLNHDTINDAIESWNKRFTR